MAQTVVLYSPRQRRVALDLIGRAPHNALVRISEQKRTIPQNSKLWAMLSEVSRAMPEGRRHTPEVWKALFMNACGWEVQFEAGLEGGEPFPVGHRSSRLTKEQMGELIECIQAYCARHGVELHEPEDSR